ncbi:MAG: InlB B-repeat-containing protein [Candidatus Fibromonas sp.]|jgi:hypothetical protein|nr:InlB B-repeat-containing protein [Candidatus Fibromonas sp.]
MTKRTFPTAIAAILALMALLSSAAFAADPPFTITLDADVGTVVGEDEILTNDEGKLAVMPPEPTAPDVCRTFVEWQDENDEKVTTATEFDDDATITAIWRRTCHIITLDADNSTANTTVYATVAVGDPATAFRLTAVPPAPTTIPACKAFNRWETSSNAQVTIGPAGTSFNSDQTITAKYIDMCYTISLDKNVGSISPEIIGTVPTNSEGKLAPLPSALPDPDGCRTFDKWVSQSDVAVTTNTVFNANATIKATWTRNCYEITFKATGNTDKKVKADVPATDPDGGFTIAAANIPADATPPDECKDFNEWQKSGATVTNATEFNSDSDVIADWTATCYIITVDSKNGTQNTKVKADVEADDPNDGFKLLDVPPAPTTRPACKEFSKWVLSTNTSTEVTTSTEFSSDATIEAVWTPTGGCIVVTFDFNLPTGTKPSETIEAENGILVSSPPSPTLSGFTFDGWYWYYGSPRKKITQATDFTDNGANSDPVTVYAEWTPVATTPGGGGGGNAAYIVTFVDWDGTVLKTQAVVSGRAATAPTTPTRAGYIFKNWDTPFTSVTSAITVKAVYESSAPIIKPKTASNFNIVLNGNSFQITGISQSMPVHIYNLQGKIMMTRTAMPNESVSIAHLPKGMYIVKAGSKTVRLAR